MSAQNLTDGTFAAEVLQSEVPVLVDFWAPWCGPCRMMSPIVDELSAELGDRAGVVKVNIDEARATAVRYGITSIPSFAVIRGGEVQQRFSGVVPKHRLLQRPRSAPWSGAEGGAEFLRTSSARLWVWKQMPEASDRHCTGRTK